MSRVSLRRPRALPKGGTIGVVSPSSPVYEDRLLTGITWLEEQGFRVVLAPHARDRNGHMAGEDRDRAADLQAMYLDEGVDAVICARGGCSAIRLWKHLDWESLAAAPPKIFCGYSDITSLHIPFGQRLSLVSFHSPMIIELASRITQESRDWMFSLLQGAGAPGEVPGRATETLVGGVVEGPLCGGCLTLVRSTVGTPYQIDVEGKLVIIEDVGGAPRHIERDLVQMIEAGILDRAAGFIVGEATDCDESDSLPMRKVWEEVLAPLGKPCVLGFPVGHVRGNLALPLGVRARLDAGGKALTLLEPAVE